MDSSCDKFHDSHDFHSRDFIDTNFSTDSKFSDEALTFPLEKFHQVFEKVKNIYHHHVHGDLLIDISWGPLIHHLHSASDCFKDIVLMRITDSCILEINRWRHDRTGAFCWKHASSFVAEKQGKSELCEDKEMQLKDRIKHVIKCDLDGENITEPVETPQGDCVITAWLLEGICQSQSDFLRYLRKILNCLKPGGRFILLGTLNVSYYANNGKKVRVFKYGKEFLFSALTGEDVVIDHSEVFKRTVQSDFSDVEGIIFVSAHKKE